MPRIMIVDDEDDLRMLISLVLGKVGYETLMAENGDDLFTKIPFFPPDLILLDVMMPGMPIHDILTQLRDAHGNPPVILFTVLRFTDAERKELFATGNVVGYLTKPFDIPQLLRTISEHAPQGHDQSAGCNITAA